MAWWRAIRPLPLPSGQMAVAFALASYANAADGQNARPGLSRLQWAASVSRTTVTGALDYLERNWLIFCYERGNGRGLATVWGLTVHDEIPALGVPYETWAEERRPADSERKRSPARPFAQGKGLWPPLKGSSGAA